MKTLVNVETNKSVTDFINSIKDDTKREDCKKLVKIIQKITGKKPKIWGDNFIIGFGKYKYHRRGSKDKYEWFNLGFAPRKTNLTIYVSYDVSKEKTLLKKLGKCTFGRGCLHIKSLETVDLESLKKIILKSKDSSMY